MSAGLLGFTAEIVVPHHVYIGAAWPAVVPVIKAHADLRSDPAAVAERYVVDAIALARLVWWLSTDEHRSATYRVRRTLRLLRRPTAWSGDWRRIDGRLTLVGVVPLRFSGALAGLARADRRGLPS